jgi:tetratricopeptide (TPR) repeat protein
MTDDRLERVRLLYERAVFHGEADAVERGHEALDGLEADLALERGRLLHARYLEEREPDANAHEVELFERAAALYRRLGDGRGEGEALLWVGIYRQVVDGEHEAARPVLERAHELAAGAGDKLTLSYVVRHLGFADADADRLDEARERFTESVRLREEIGFAPGVAAGLVALAELDARQGDLDGALRRLDEAQARAEASDARGVLRWVDHIRTELAVKPRIS